jgi:hypothetical protein
MWNLLPHPPQYNAKTTSSSIQRGGRKLDSDFSDRHSTHVLAVHPPAVHEGPGANLDPPSFLRHSDLQDRIEAREFLAPAVPELAG